VEYNFSFGPGAPKGSHDALLLRVMELMSPVPGHIKRRTRDSRMPAFGPGLDHSFCAGAAGKS